MTEEEQEAIERLQEILQELGELGQEAKQLIADNFPEELSTGEAYQAFTFGSSCNPYDTTLEKIVEGLEENNQNQEANLDAQLNY